MLSASASYSATCSQFEEKQPSVHAVSLDPITSGLSTPLMGHAGIYGVFVFIRPACQNSDLLPGEGR